MGFSKLVLSLTLFSGQAMAQYASMSLMSPSTYSTHLADTRNLVCDTIIPVLDPKGLEILPLCKKDFRSCRFEGACVVETEKGKVGLTYHSFDEIKEQVYFAKIDVNKCPFGLGYINSKIYKQIKTPHLCLDPFFSVAADLKAYNIGDVLHVPTLEGVELPSGEIHDGFVVVRDSSTFLEGAGNYRISFFTGFLDAENTDNVFARRGLTDVDNEISFRLATKEEADRVRAKRNFPSLPAHLFQQGK